MKRVFYILAAALLGAMACTKEASEMQKPATEESGLVAIKMQLTIPVPINAQTKAGDRAELAREGELSEEHIVRPRHGDLLGSGEQAEQNGKIIDRSGFFRIGGCEIHRDTADGKIPAAVFDRRADPVARLLNGGVRQADDIESGQAVRYIRFKLHLVASDPAQAERANP